MRPKHTRRGRRPHGKFVKLGHGGGSFLKSQINSSSNSTKRLYILRKKMKKLRKRNITKSAFRKIKRGSVGKRQSKTDNEDSGVIYAESLSSSQNSDKETPTTSTQVIGNTNTSTPRIQINLKDISNNSRKQERSRRTLLKTKSPKSSLKTSTVGQIITRRLLRSIRKRQNPKFDQSQCVITSKKRKLNFIGNENAKVKVNSNDTPLTLVEGVILSEEDDFDVINNTKDRMESDNVDHTNTKVNDEDDDCVYIEPYVELITIEDETDAKPVSSPSDKDNSTLVITSTPLEKPKTSFSTLASFIRSKNQEKATEEKPKESPPMFYVDNGQGKSSDTIISGDTDADYSKFSTLQPGKNEKQRRSERLKEKRNSKYFSIDDDDDASNDVVVLEDTTLKLQSTSLNEKPSGKNADQENDDSVIFVSESTPDNLLTFIPLKSCNVPNPIRIVPNPITPKTKRPRVSLFTRSEKKQLSEYNDNAYNPCSHKRVPANGKRMVIIDGSNVAYSHALNREFSVAGLRICLEYFEKMGHEVKAVVPQFRLSKFKSTSPEELEALHSVGKIVFTPCKNLPSTKTISYDDRFILQLACELDAVVVSNDNYRDLIIENTAFKKIIEQRVIGYTWCNDIFILPKDPYGKWGPPLHMILNRS